MSTLILLYFISALKLFVTLKSDLIPKKLALSSLTMMKGKTKPRFDSDKFKVEVDQ